MNNKFLRNYKENGFDFVAGWCNLELFAIIDLLDSVAINKRGGCLEIGVHHGKFYILLNSVIDSGHKSYAIDLFENQSLNIDQSGRGNLHAFKNNLEKFDRHKGVNTEIISGDSTDFSATKQLSLDVGLLRFISIDGGHSAEHTVSDLRLAERLIANEGVVILDDILNYHWLGVIAGAVAFLHSKPSLVPFAIGHNKLFLSKISFHAYYLNLMNSSPLRTKTVDFFGYEVVAL